MYSTQAEPFLKWAGGKRLLLAQLLQHIPSPAHGSRYFEPFLGGGAVFFSVGPERASLSDINSELIETYEVVRDSVEALIEALSSIAYSKEMYYKVRTSRPRSAIGRAARFIYLNKTCFNGLFRVNMKGEFNVPFGQHGPNLEICNRSQLRAASAMLARSVLISEDFEAAVSQARSGDVVYFDPPYIVSHNNNGFVEYNAKVFSWADQRRLARISCDLVDRGVVVVVSNADHQAIHELYCRSGHLEARHLHRWSTIAGKANKRIKTTELVLVGGASHRRGE
jgi:DNA adenine methylase